LPCNRTWQRLFAVHWRTAKGKQHDKDPLPCTGARQRHAAHGKGATNGKEPMIKPSRAHPTLSPLSPTFVLATSPDAPSRQLARRRPPPLAPGRRRPSPAARPYPRWLPLPSPAARHPPPATTVPSSPRPCPRRRLAARHPRAQLARAPSSPLPGLLAPARAQLAPSLCHRPGLLPPSLRLACRWWRGDDSMKDV
jgi:hypothetical protein